MVWIKIPIIFGTKSSDSA